MNAPVRLLILSDLHLEFASFEPPDASLFDIAVLAGDIAVGVKAVHWARRDATFGGKPVVLVPGNHEFYGSERSRMLAQLREAAAGTHVHLLDRDEVILQGIRFLGATLWTDFALDVAHGTDIDQAMGDARVGLSDFSGSILEREPDDKGRRRFTPEEAAGEHGRSRSWLGQRLISPVGSDVLDTVVVTHHAPSSRSMDPIYEGSVLNPCFYSELPASFFQTASLWVHGHTHSSSDYRHHATRIVANPRGYRRRDGSNENRAFSYALVVTVPSVAGTGVDHAEG